MALEIDVNACAEGDRGAWDEFINQTTGLVISAVRRTAGSQLNNAATPDVDDCVQAVYLRLLRNDCSLMRNYDPERAALSTWLTLIARSVTIDLLKRKSLPTLALQDFDREANPNIEVPAEAKSLDHVAPMHLLSERQELVLRLLFEDSRSVSQVATSLEVSEQTVRSTKHKALKRLRAHFNTHINAKERPK